MDGVPSNCSEILGSVMTVVAIEGALLLLLLLLVGPLMTMLLRLAGVERVPSLGLSVRRLVCTPENMVRFDDESEPGQDFDISIM